MLPKQISSFVVGARSLRRIQQAKMHTLFVGARLLDVRVCINMIIFNSAASWCNFALVCSQPPLHHTAPHCAESVPRLLTGANFHHDEALRATHSASHARVPSEIEGRQAAPIPGNCAHPDLLPSPPRMLALLRLSLVGAAPAELIPETPCSQAHGRSALPAEGQEAAPHRER